jgi:ubiquinone/menaquinone biosynthesis C-methylase UbiE
MEATILIDVANLQAGERDLDVACGTGVVTRRAAKCVGAAGTVAGLDVNPGMLAVARSQTPPDLSIQWYEGNAESMPLPDGAFDVVLCQMGFQFVPGKVAALREMRRQSSRIRNLCGKISSIPKSSTASYRPSSPTTRICLGTLMSRTWARSEPSFSAR